MPIYMDVQIVPGVKASDVAEAHKKTLVTRRSMVVLRDLLD